MSVAERDFYDFKLSDNVYELADGLVPEIAERAGIDPGSEPTSDVLGRLVGVLGKNKVLRNNVEVDFLSLNKMAEYIDRAGTQMPLKRSLWTPQSDVPATAPRLMTGGVANWMDRSADLLIRKAEFSQDSTRLKFDPKALIFVTGNREMGSPTELANSNVQDYLRQHGRVPTETRYAEKILIPKLRYHFDKIRLASYDTKDGNEIARNFVSEYITLFDKGAPMSFVRVANAGVQLAVQFRTAVKAINGRYDSLSSRPQVFVETDSLPVARTDEQRQDSRHYQAPQTGLRQAILTAKMIHEAAGGQ